MENEFEELRNYRRKLAAQMNAEFFKYINEQMLFRELQKRIPIYEFISFNLSPLRLMVNKKQLPNNNIGYDGAMSFRYQEFLPPKQEHRFRIIFN